MLEGIAGEVVGEQREFVGTIREKGEQLLTLIKGLLDLSKLESGTMSLRKASVDVAPLLRDVAQTMTPQAMRKGIAIQAESEPMLPQLWADAERLRQILLNLVENAIKFTPAGGTVKVLARSAQLVSSQSGDEGGLVLLGAARAAVELCVTDTGIGIRKGARARIMLYMWIRARTGAGGTCLGLRRAEAGRGA